MNMQQHLIDAGFNFVAANNEQIIVQDPRHKNYRVYSASTDPSQYHNAWIDAPKMTFDFVTEAADYAGIKY